VGAIFLYCLSIYGKHYIMAKKYTKQLLFENMEKLNPGFEQPKDSIEEIAPIAPTPTAGAQQTQQYASGSYKIMANQLKLVNTIDKFAPAFKDWFQYLGYSPQAGNMTVQRARMDVEAILKQLGYK
jgi:hypothetical protein